MDEKVINFVIDGFEKTKGETTAIKQPYRDPVLIIFSGKALFAIRPFPSVPRKDSAFRKHTCGVIVVIGHLSFHFFGMFYIGKVSIQNKLVLGISPKSIPVIETKSVGIEKSTKGAFIPEHDTFLFIDFTLCHDMDGN